MKAKTKFKKMIDKLPKKSRAQLIYEPYGSIPCTLAVCWVEIEHNTKLGLKILRDLGYEDDKDGKEV